MRAYDKGFYTAIVVMVAIDVLIGLVKCVFWHKGCP